MGWLRRAWKANGTKILGVLVVIATYADFAANDILEALPHAWRPLGKLVIVTLGYFIVRRGYRNDAHPGDGPVDRPPPPSAPMGENPFH